MKIFDILIYSVAALGLILLLFAVWQNLFAPQTNINEIKSAIELAQTKANLGKGVSLGEILYQKDSLIDKKDFEEKYSLVAIECLSPAYCCQKNDSSVNEKCDKPVSWNYESAKISQDKKLLTIARCTDFQGTLLCRLFLGATPAQAKVEKAEVVSSEQGVGEIKLTLANTGSVPLVKGETTLTLYKKSGATWMQTNYPSASQGIDYLQTKEEYEQQWEITPTNSGEYRAEFTFSGSNAGFDVKTADFALDTAKLCITTTAGDTIFSGEEGKYQEIHNCTGCNYAFECASAWEQQTGKTFYPDSAESAYCIKSSSGGAC